MVLNNESNRIDIEKHYSRIKHQVINQIKGRVRKSDREEILQEVFLALLQNQKRFDPGKNQNQTAEKAVLAWVNGITKFKLREYFEQRKRESRQESEYEEKLTDLADRSSPSTKLESDDYKEKFVESLEKCDPRTVQAMQLQLAGLSGEEIAKEMNWTVDQVYKRLSRFRKNLKATINAQPECENKSLYASKNNLVDVFSEAIRKRSLDGCRYELEDGQANYQRLFDYLYLLEPEIVEKLIQARGIIHECEHIKLEDKPYATDELNEFTFELLAEKPRQEELKTRWNHLNFVSPLLGDLLKPVVQSTC